MLLSPPSGTGGGSDMPTKLLLCWLLMLSARPLSASSRLFRPESPPARYSALREGGTAQKVSQLKLDISVFCI